MINISNLTLIRGQNTLFDNVNLALHGKQKMGLIGANGAGKSSLFAMLLHQLEPTIGEISVPKSYTIAHVEQEIKDLSLAAIDYVLQGDTELARLNNELDIAESAEDFDKIVAIHGKIADIDGYQAPTRAAKILAGLGFSDAQQSSAIKNFSGGWQMRLNLAKTLMCRSDLLLLDEPTNHLDLDAIVWLEKYLQSFPGTLIVISHDREFLDNVTECIVHIEHSGIKSYQGNYSTFERQRAEHLAMQQAMFEKQQKKIAHMMLFVNRFRAKASKAKQAQSRLKNIDRMEIIAAVQAESEFNFEFFPAKDVPHPILTLRDVQLGYGEHIVLRDVNWQLAPGDRVGLLGVNGAGKSTLIKALCQGLTPQQGELCYAKDLPIAYFAQHQLEQLNADNNPLQQMQELAKNKTASEMRKFLGGFGFSGEKAMQKIGTLSGGEKARLVLATLVWQRPALLLLDEPTNHLDMDMRNALTLALQSYQGALVLVSHDRHLLRNTCDQLWMINAGRLQSYEGDLDDYYDLLLKQKKQDAKLKSETAAVPEKTASTQAAPSKEPLKSNRKNNPVKLKHMEQEISQLEKSLQNMANQLSDPDFYQSASESDRDRLFEQQQQLQNKLQLLEEQWMAEMG